MIRFLVIGLFVLSGVLFAQTSSDSLTVNPNPFVKRSLIRYYLASADTTSLIVLNTLGATTITFYTNILKASGNYQDSLIMDNFPDGIYFISLKPKHRSALSQKIIKTSTTSIRKTEIFNNLKVYPNPASEILTIKSPGFTSYDLRYELFDCRGNILLKGNLFEPGSEINLKELPQGFYILKVLNNDNMKCVKVIKE